MRKHSKNILKRIQKGGTRKAFNRVGIIFKIKTMYEITTKQGHLYGLNLDDVRIYTNPRGEKIVHSNGQVVHLNDLNNDDKKKVLKAYND